MVGTDLLLSFDVTVALPRSVTIEPRDLVRWNATGVTRFFDGAAAGVPAGLKIDAVHLLESPRRLLLSFDGAGTVGEVTFEKNDVLEYNTSTHVWRLVYDGSVRRPGWAGGNLDALVAFPTPSPVH